MVMHPTESKDIAVNHVRGKVVRIRPRMDTQRKDVKKFSNPSHLRSSMRGLTRTFGVARNTVKVWLKKKQQICPI
jgi:hypothetical protein